MEAFWSGFEKRAGMMQQAGKFLGNVTGARQLKAGFGQVKHQMGKGNLGRDAAGNLMSTPGAAKRVQQAGRNLAIGGAKALGTAAATTAAVGYGANKMLSSPQQ